MSKENEELLQAIDFLKYYRKFLACGPGECPCKYANICNDKDKGVKVYNAIATVLKALKTIDL